MTWSECMRHDLRLTRRCFCSKYVWLDVLADAGVCFVINQPNI